MTICYEAESSSALPLPIAIISVPRPRSADRRTDGRMDGWNSGGRAASQVQMRCTAAERGAGWTGANHSLILVAKYQLGKFSSAPSSNRLVGQLANLQVHASWSLSHWRGTTEREGDLRVSLSHMMFAFVRWIARSDCEYM